MPSKQKGKVRFHSPANERVELSNDSEKRKYRKPEKDIKPEDLPHCDGHNFPCIKGNITFDNMKDLNEYLYLKDLNRSKLIDRKLVVKKIKSEGKYRQYIPQENRLYDLDTGKIYDVAAYRAPPSRRRTTQKGGRNRGRSHTRRCKK